MMIKIPLSEMISKISKKTGLSDDDVSAKIDEKCASLSGLVSKEGAANILANELGVKLFESSGKIKSIYPGMRNVEFLGKIISIYEKKEFSRQDGSTGMVASFLVGDETGNIKVVCWNDQVELIDRLKVDDIVRIQNVFVRENRGFKEVHLNDKSNILINPAGESVESIKISEIERKKIKDLKEDERVEILATVVQLFDPRFFEVCPNCNSRLKEEEGVFSCAKHGSVSPDFNFVLNAVLDDGSDTIRGVFFREQAEQFLGKSADEIKAFRSVPEAFDPIKFDFLGDQFTILGRVKKNVFFDRLEFVAQKVNKADPSEELKNLEDKDK
jgi:replication factor A1